MIEAQTVATVRAAEVPLIAAGVPLMDRAAFALAGTIVRELRYRRGRVAGARVALLVGSGNNGGDALFAGAYLRRRGVEVTAYGVGSRVHDDGVRTLVGAGGTFVDLTRGSGVGVTGGETSDADVAGARAGASAEAVAVADIVVDGMLGTGASGPLRGASGELVAALKERWSGRDARDQPFVVAVDLPSGIDADTGALPGEVLAADVTVTFGAAKRGLLLPPAAGVCGRVEVVDLGLGAAIEDALDEQSGRGPADAAEPVPLGRLLPGDLTAWWPVPGASAQKYTRGVLGLVAGTSEFPGAAVLAASSAVLAGSGMVRYVGPDAVARSVVAARPEVVPVRGRVQAWALGPGLPAADADEPVGSGPTSDVAAQHAEVRAALVAAGNDVDPAGRVPAVVDAGALSLLPERVPASVVLTPHAGELAALLRGRGHDVTRADVEAEPLRHARLALEITGATVLLKGAVTVVVGPEVLYSQADAPAWLATAGAGDVLTGILGTLLAAYGRRAVDEPALPARLAAMAASLHGLAADAANPGGPVAALGVAQAVPGVVARLVALR